MSTKFFNNNEGNTLFDKLKGIASGMTTFDRFLAVVGFFRSSGYFKLRKELGDVKEIKVLVGINIDNIFRKHNKAMIMFAEDQKAKEIYNEEFKNDIVNAKYSPEVEEGILQMCEDLAKGRLQMRIHATKNLHAKFYLCLPQQHTEHSDGWVIMGSSNISDSGLGITQPPRYELNVAMKDFDDVKYCTDEFWRLWEEAVPLSVEDIQNNKKQTYLGYQPTPYEIYIKVLISTFGDQVEDDFTLQLPEGVIDLKYQKDAVIQGYQMLMRHNGLFLADVVGLGKTVIATMIAKRFIEANGKNTNVLVVYPPAVEENWKDTFKLFGIKRKAQFITNGSLSKILDGRDQYRDPREFDLVIVDEAHGFRNDDSGKYDELQKICKAPCDNLGLLNSRQKKVMLLSATPLNNRPEDLMHLILLFQNSQNCTIDGIPNLKSFFAPYNQAYKRLMAEREKRDVTTDVDLLYAEIRDRLIDKITIRRTRNNIMNDKDYREDVKSQGIIFPHILPPHEVVYQMDEDTSKRFYDTLAALSDEENEQHLFYARYRAVEFLKPEYQERYSNAEHIGQTLAGIYRVHMVKRLESSFYAFKQSLRTLLRITDDMLKMIEQDKVIIAPDLKVKELQQKDMELDQIIALALEKGYLESEITFKASAFRPEFVEMLQNDKQVLEHLNADWERENDDPKFDEFKNRLLNEFLSEDINPTGKLVIFSESVDTLDYLFKRLTKEMGRKDVLEVTSADRNKKRNEIKQNFDANSPIKKNDYNIIVTSDVMAEGVNLHQSNVIINYDSPWNATRLMQRIGRVNRIGSTADSIYNYMFYPSAQGDKEIQLYKNALVKLQGFHSAFGEDAQIYSREEIVKQFELFDSKVKDSIDRKIALLREVRDLYNSDRKLYHKIKELPMKSRVLRKSEPHKGKSIVFVSSNVKTEFYLVHDENVSAVDFLSAVDYLKASPDELPEPFDNGLLHYQHVDKALKKYTSDFVEAADPTVLQTNRRALDRVSAEALSFLRKVKQVSTDTMLHSSCDILKAYVEEGVYAQLPRALRELNKKYKDKLQIKNNEYAIQTRISQLIDEYHTMNATERHDAADISDPQIIISESFIK